MMQGREKEIVSQIKKLLQTGQKDKARQLLITYVRQNPNDAGAWWALSRVVENRQQEKECLQRVLKLKPDHAQARRRWVTLTAPDNLGAERSILPKENSSEQKQAQIKSAPRRSPSAQKKKKISSWVIMSIGTFFLLGIAGIVYFSFVIISDVQAMNAPVPQSQVGALPTATFIPPKSLPATWTPTPTNTPLPTRTPFPTFTSLPDVPTFTMPPRVEGVTTGTYAVDFTLQKSGSGKYVSLSDYGGHPVIIVFFATWCGYCEKEVPALKEIYEKYKEQGFVVLAVNIGDSAKKVSDYQNKHNITYPILLDPKKTIQRRYQVSGVPYHCMVNKNGKIIYSASGMFSASALDAQARNLLADFSR